MDASSSRVTREMAATVDEGTAELHGASLVS